MAELIYPDASNWINSYEAGQKAGMTERKDATARQAGGLMASGNYAGAAKAYFQGGDVTTGAAVADYGTKQDASQRQAKFRQAIATNDLTTAGQLAAGDPELHKLYAEHVADVAETLATSAQPLKGMNYDQAKQHYTAKILPRLHQLGYSGPGIDDWDPSPANIQDVETKAIGLKESLGLHKPEWHEVKNADGSTHFTDLNPYNRQPDGTDAPPTPAATTAQPPPAPTGGVYDQVAHVAGQNGAKPEEVSYLTRLAQVESSGDPNAQNGRSTGVFQFHPDTFAGLGGHDIHSVPEQTYAALALSRRDRQNLTQLGIEPSDANVYIMHQQGAGGGRALLTSDPNTKAIDVLTPIYGSAAVAQKAIVNNGGSPDMTAGQFVGMWQQRWQGVTPAAAASAHPASARIGGPPTVAGSAAQAPEWQSDGHGLLINHRTGDRKEDPAAVSAGEADGLTPDAIHLLAGRYLKDGTIPPLGMGKNAAAARQKILNEATAMAKAIGATPEDLVAGTLSVKAAGQALGKATQLRSVSEGFEQTALKNADLMLSLAPKGGGQTNAPVVNRWLQAGRKQVAGDSDVSNFEIALGTFADEYAKIVSGSTGSQGSTDSSRKEAYDRLSKYATQGQLQGGVETMKREMANRIDSLHEVEDGLRSQIRGGGHEPAAAPASNPAKVIRYDAQGNRVK